MTTKTTNKIFFKSSGKVKAILNWQTMKNGDALLLSDTLDTEHLNLYEGFKELGKDDQFIFEKFFSPKKTKKLLLASKKVDTLEVTIEIEQLTKSQLTYLIEREIKAALPTLKKMSKEDLVTLFLKLVD